jgi:hypothetical protein
MLIRRPALASIVAASLPASRRIARAASAKKILQSTRESLPELLKRRADEACAQVMSLERDPGASFTYTCFRARASW